MFPLFFLCKQIAGICMESPPENEILSAIDGLERKCPFKRTVYSCMSMHLALSMWRETVTYNNFLCLYSWHYVERDSNVLQFLLSVHLALSM